MSKEIISTKNAPQAIGPYSQAVKTGNLMFISGQIPLIDGKMIQGKVGEDTEVETAIKAARACGLAIIAQLKEATNSKLDSISRIVKLGGFVNCVDTFTQQPEIINGASDLMVEVFEEKGKHSRFAVGTNSLPRGVVVEIEAIAEIQ